MRAQCQEIVGFAPELGHLVVNKHKRCLHARTEKAQTKNNLTD